MGLASMAMLAFEIFLSLLSMIILSVGAKNECDEDEHFLEEYERDLACGVTTCILGALLSVFAEAFDLGVQQLPCGLMGVLDYVFLNMPVNVCMAQFMSYNEKCALRDEQRNFGLFNISAMFCSSYVIFTAAFCLIGFELVPVAICILSAWGGIFGMIWIIVAFQQMNLLSWQFVIFGIELDFPDLYVHVQIGAITLATANIVALARIPAKAVDI